MISEVNDYPAAADPAPAGVPYHLLARDARHRWWRPLVALLVFAVLAFVLLLAVMLVLGASVLYPAGFGDLRIAGLVLDPDSVEALVRDPFALLFVSFGALVSLIPAAVLTALWVQRRSPRQLLSLIHI